MEADLGRKTQDVFFWVATGVVAAVAFVYSGHTFPLGTVPVTFPRETVFFTLAAAAIIFAILRGGGEFEPRRRMAFLLLAGFAAWAILASLWASYTVGHSRRLVELAFFCGWAFALSVLAVPLEKARKFTWILGFTGAVVGFGVAIGGPLFDMPSRAWPFGNPNAAGMFCAFAALLNTGLMLTSLKKHRPQDAEVILPAACLGLAILGLVLTFSKGALLGLIIGEAVLAWQTFPKWRKTAIICTAVVLIAATGVYLIRASARENLADTTSGFRMEAYKASVKQIGDAPIGGRGLGTFYAYFPYHAYPAISGHKKMGDAVFHAHSNVLEIGTELGIVGMALFIAFTVYLGILPLLKKEPGGTERDGLETIWVGAFLAISVHAMVAVHFYWTETVLYYWTAVGVLLALGRKSPGSREEGPENTQENPRSSEAGWNFPPVLRTSIASNRLLVLPFALVVAVSLAGLWYVGVYRELLGRTYVTMREKQLKYVRIKDKEFTQLGNELRRKGPRGREERIERYRKIQIERHRIYSMIIAELNEELALVYDPRMRSDTYYQLGSAYYNIGGIILGQAAPKEAFQAIADIDLRSKLTPPKQGRPKHMKKQYGAALHFFNTVMDDAPLYVNTNYFVARAYQGLWQQPGLRQRSPKKFEEYQKKAIKALELYLHYNIRAKMVFDATKMLASDIYRPRKQFQDAIRILERYLVENPQAEDSGEATRLLAATYASAKQIPEAMEAIERHLEANPKSKKKRELTKYLAALKNAQLQQKKKKQKKKPPGTKPRQRK